MDRARRFATPAALLVLGLALASSGCGAVTPDNVTVLRLRIPAYDEAALEGLWMWRFSEQTGDFEPLTEIRFDDTVFEAGQEYLEYSLLDRQGQPLQVRLSAEVVRNGDAADLSLWFVRFAAPGEFKASTYNAAGASGLSAETLYF